MLPKICYKRLQQSNILLRLLGKCKVQSASGFTCVFLNAPNIPASKREKTISINAFDGA